MCSAETFPDFDMWQYLESKSDNKHEILATLAKPLAAENDYSQRTLAGLATLASQDGKSVNQTLEALYETYAERAAIRAYDGDITSEHAEKQAFTETLQNWLSTLR